MRDVSIDHYENFPVASALCPPRLRPPIRAIYAYARTADDLADEGEAPPQARLDALDAYRADLDALYVGGTVSNRWPAVFGPLAAQVRAHALPHSLLADLLSAFAQDVTVHRHADRAALLGYCRRSANPIGRLLLHLYGIDRRESLAQSDAICTALQLINFWQDLSVDLANDRLYIPLTDCARRGVDPAALLRCEDGPQARALIGDMVAWARALMRAGAPLALALPGRVGWELRLVVQGGLRIADKLAEGGYDALLRRPTIGRADAPLLLWRALTMRHRLARPSLGAAT